MVKLGEEVFAAESPIFVVGAPRSGTTLVERMLDAHPAIAILDELVFFDHILALRREIPQLDTPQRRERFFQLLPQLDHVRFWRGLDPVLARVREELEQAGARASWQLFYLLLMKRAAEARGKRRYGEKTPWNVRHLATIVRWFPDARIVHVVRDPRAQVASRRQLPRSSHDVLTHAVKWRLDVDLGRRALARWPRPANVIEVRYEDLLAEPEAQLKRICQAVGEPFDPTMLDFYRIGEPGFRGQPWKDNVRRPLGATNPERWRKELDAWEVAAIEWIAGRTMRELGYQPLTPPLERMLRTLAGLPREFARWRQFKRVQPSELDGPLSQRLSAEVDRSLYRELLRWMLRRA